jgi:hypothetical protein
MTLLGQPCLKCRVDLTPATPAKPSPAVRASGRPPVARSVQKAAEWRQTAAQRRAAGNAAGAEAAERNAVHWLAYGRSQQGS